MGKYRHTKRFDDEDHADQFEKFSKIRRKSKITKKKEDQKHDFELDEAEWGDLLAKGWFAARVVEVHKRYAFISTEPIEGDVDTSDVWLATIARKYLQVKREQRNFISVGDRVICEKSEESTTGISSELPQCVIQNMKPRKSKIARLDPHRPELEHVLATNMDQLVFVASYLKPTVKWGLIDRYLVLAERENLPAIIVLNKVDLLKDEADEEFREDAKRRVAEYRRIGYQVVEIQANTSGAARTKAAQSLKALLDGKVSLFSGHSGVGKSSIVNLYKPEIVQVVEPDEDIFYKGRHTTTYASFIKLKTGGCVIDTPGIRSFLIAEMESIDLSHCFVEMRPLIGMCKFRECSHQDEPECAVRDAVEKGAISPWRYKSYLSILHGASGREGRLRDMDLEDFEGDIEE